VFITLRVMLWVVILLERVSRPLRVERILRGLARSVRSTRDLQIDGGQRVFCGLAVRVVAVAAPASGLGFQVLRGSKSLPLKNAFRDDDDSGPLRFACLLLPARGAVLQGEFRENDPMRYS
jgi:hypothetical protein